MRNFFLVVAIFLSACTGASEQELIASARKSYGQEKYSEAVIKTKNVLQTNKNSAEARYLLGASLYATGDLISAEIELRKAMDLAHPDSEVVPALAKAMFDMRNFRRLTDEFGSLQLADALAANNLKSTLAMAYAAQNDNVRANDLIESILLKTPDFIPALLVKARILAGEEKFEESEHLIDSILLKNPGDADAMLIKAEISPYLSKDISISEALYRDVLKLRKNDMTANDALMAIYFSQNNIVAAKKHFSDLMKVAPNRFQTKFYSAQFAFIEENYKSAREQISALLRIWPDSTKLLQFAGAVEMKLGSLSEAEAHFLKALSLNPDSPSVRRTLAQVYLRSGRASKSLDVLKPLLAQSPVAAETMSLAAEAYVQQGDQIRAEEFFQQANMTKPGDVKIMTALAMTRLGGKKESLGFEDLSSIAASDKGEFADLALINARLGRKEWALALEAIGNYERKMPDRPTPPALRGKVQERQGDLGAARKSFELALTKDKYYYPAIAALTDMELRGGELKHAVERLERFTNANPKHVMALLSLANLKKLQGASDDVVTAVLNDAVRGNPSDPVARVALISNLRMKNDFKGALAAAQAGVVAVPDSLELLDTLGFAQMNMSEWNQSLSTFKKLASLQPQSVKPYLRMADVYSAMKENDSVKKVLKSALEVDPKNLDARIGLITVAMRENQPADALQSAREVQRQLPGEAIGFLLEGDIFVVQKKYSEAIAIYKVGLKKSNTSRLPKALVEAYGQANRIEDQQSFVLGWVNDHPKDLAFLIFAGDQALMRGGFSEAEGLYRKALAIDAKNFQVMNNIAWLMLQQKKGGAAAMAATAVALAPKHSASLDTYALALLDERKYKEALAAENSAIALSPNIPEYRLNLAKIYMAMNDKKKAVVELEKLKSLGDRYGNQAEVAGLLRVATQ
ncbi:XrtA/PEP-CTERM system TPR-repeat protein PrsT [Roseateles oligotrophus]|uniref:PEP-CTERM system TPR-repeat protein PrsT n=1 Tax=Roseateles oligotrophus TaxID=1769250 RepID=A0ABT2YF99_9BURK|nr:XrtA/PEP-CTERM system TPR-repeat protein PrsT [Roseateles oligotrophus]MCV2368717.1 PEP-CTERM system TPR-repeat protein PrsT [Roseateles oligotrophus]